MEQDPRIETMLAHPGVRLARLALAHFALWLALFCLFAAAESWHQLSTLGLAGALAIITGAIAGFASANLLHEWSHLLGAVIAGGRYTIPDRLGLFVYDWDFEANNTPQFYTMSIAGSIGGGLAALLLWQAVDLSTSGQLALIAGAVASFVFAAIVEWPVLWRTRRSNNPLSELSKTSPRVLLRAAIGSAAAGLALYGFL